MLHIEYFSKEKGAQAKQVNAAKCLLGSGSKADIELSGWKVQKEHAELFVSNDQVFVRDFGSMFGTLIKGQKISTYGPILVDDEISIGQYQLKVSWKRKTHNQVTQDTANLSVEAVTVSSKNSFAPIDLSLLGAQPEVKKSIEHISTKSIDQPSSELKVNSFQSSVVIDQEMLGLRRDIHDKLLLAFDMRRMDVHKMDDKILREHTETAIKEILKAMPDLPKHIDREVLLCEVRDESIGLGLLEPLLADPTTTEIMVNSVDEIFVERQGVLQRVALAFSSEKAVMGIIERIVAPVGRRIDESSPLVDARLKDGSRFNAIIPPLALKGPSMTIRKFSKKKLDGRDLLRFNSASQNMVDFLQLAVKQKKNIIVSGGTGSGKTTLLNILSNFIPSDERIVTIEDAAELQLDHEHLVSLEARPGNSEGKGGVSIRDLVKNSLRMRPDRIVVGECRGGEALDMLQAMNTGHDGSLTTAHANTPRDMLARVEIMVLMSGMDLPITAIREQVASAIDIIVQQTRFACGSRKISKITEVTGVESGKIQLQDIFEFVETGVDQNHKTDGYYSACDAIPEFYEKLRSIGLNLDTSIFKREVK
jgi:pilus assembly protein CpaF